MCNYRFGSECNTLSRSLRSVGGGAGLEVVKSEQQTCEPHTDGCDLRRVNAADAQRRVPLYLARRAQDDPSAGCGCAFF
jgi:hypothetical protein